MNEARRARGREGMIIDIVSALQEEQAASAALHEESGVDA